MAIRKCLNVDYFPFELLMYSSHCQIHLLFFNYQYKEKYDIPRNGKGILSCLYCLSIVTLPYSLVGVGGRYLDTKKAVGIWGGVSRVTEKENILARVKCKAKLPPIKTVHQQKSSSESF